MNKKFFFFLIAIPLLLVGCTNNNSNTNNSIESSNDDSSQHETTSNEFLGDKGEAVIALNGEVKIAESKVSDGNLKSFNYFSANEGKDIYFFVVRADDGTYRVAANACEVCYGAKMGFEQVGDSIRCNNCWAIFKKDTIAKEKGGCNPSPIDANAEVINGELKIDVNKIEAVSYLF